MADIFVTEGEIEAAEVLSGDGQFMNALVMAQDLLCRACDDETRMRLLFNIVGCSTRLDLNDVTNEAVRTLDHLPNPNESRLFVNQSRQLR